MLKDWPDESPLTLHTLATLMISSSDNTATDALIEIVGREEIEARSARNVPLLDTTEMFQLKALPNVELLDRYQNGDTAEKRQILEVLATTPLPTPSEMPTTPALE